MKTARCSLGLSLEFSNQVVCQKRSGQHIFSPWSFPLCPESLTTKGQVKHKNKYLALSSTATTIQWWKDYRAVIWKIIIWVWHVRWVMQCLCAMLQWITPSFPQSSPWLRCGPLYSVWTPSITLPSRMLHQWGEGGHMLPAGSFSTCPHPKSFLDCSWRGSLCCRPEFSRMTMLCGISGLSQSQG